MECHSHAKGVARRSGREASATLCLCLPDGRQFVLRAGGNAVIAPIRRRL